MQEYRAYLIGPDGHINQRTDMIYADDEAAEERAKQLMHCYDVELLKMCRKSARLNINE